MKKPAWITVGEKYLGLREIPGAKHNSTIVSWLRQLRAWWFDDETPWCGVYVAAVMREAGLPVVKNWFRARAWAEYGVSCQPQVGAILVFTRAGGGHVGFYIGEDKDRFYVLGGNQGNAVSYTWISKGRLTACRWPAEVPVPNTGRVRLSGKGQPTSRNEA